MSCAHELDQYTQKHASGIIIKVAYIYLDYASRAGRLKRHGLNAAIKR